jgi:hypothetical protein
MGKLSIKKIKRLIVEEKTKALARYLRRFLLPEQRKWAEVRLDEYTHKLLKKETISKDEVRLKLKELMVEYYANKTY